MTPLPHGNDDVARRDIALAVRDVSFSYQEQPVFTSLDLEVTRNAPVAIVGASGAGKSTLLQLLAGMKRPTSGSVEVFPREPRRAGQAPTSLREFGFIFQFGELLPELTLVENVELPLLFLGERRPAAHERAMALLVDVGLEAEARRFTHAVSGGQQQRAAIARALIHQPSIVLADEPTGALDEGTADLVLDLMFDAAASQDAALVLVTHSTRVAARCRDVYELEAGRLHRIDDR